MVGGRVVLGIGVEHQPAFKNQLLIVCRLKLFVQQGKHSVFTVIGMNKVVAALHQFAGERSLAGQIDHADLGLFIQPLKAQTQQIAVGDSREDRLVKVFVLVVFRKNLCGQIDGCVFGIGLGQRTEIERFGVRLFPGKSQKDLAQIMTGGRENVKPLVAQFLERDKQRELRLVIAVLFGGFLRLIFAFDADGQPTAFSESLFCV